MDCTIVICTYNRADSLATTLNAVIEQEYSLGNLEFLVVDNGSSDNTRELVQDFIRLHPDKTINYYLESQQGIAFARNSGLKNAGTPFVAFIDDDATPKRKDWIQNLVEPFKDDSIVATGGDINPVWPKGVAPGWLPERLHPLFGQTLFTYNSPTIVHYPIYPWASNVVYRKAAAETAGYFMTSLGWVGQHGMVPGEESELCLRLEKAGGTVLYVPDAEVMHYFQEYKLNIPWVLERGLGTGKAYAIIDNKNSTFPKKIYNTLYHTALFLMGIAAMYYFKWVDNKKLETLGRYHFNCSRGYLNNIFRTNNVLI